MVQSASITAVSCARYVCGFFISAKITRKRTKASIGNSFESWVGNCQNSHCVKRSFNAWISISFFSSVLDSFTKRKEVERNRSQVSTFFNRVFKRPFDSKTILTFIPQYPEITIGSFRTSTFPSPSIISTTRI